MNNEDEKGEGGELEVRAKHLSSLVKLKRTN